MAMHLYPLTHRAWEAYRKDDPLYRSRNPSPSIWSNDVSIGFVLAVVYGAFISLAFILDSALIPFRVAANGVDTLKRKRIAGKQIAVEQPRQNKHHSRKHKQSWHR